MTAFTRRSLQCNADGCFVEFMGRRDTSGTGEDINSVRKRARAAGWTHPSGYIDLCPQHRGHRR